MKIEVERGKLIVCKKKIQKKKCFFTINIWVGKKEFMLSREEKRKSKNYCVKEK